ncbi:hypothetical protein [Nocardia sp. NPDC052566]|uniref:hypothetical protein n=1 Tax=Nocardia sp. NPDC052566 TaxID=3364330 RepID=UPI0037C627C2
MASTSLPLATAAAVATLFAAPAGAAPNDPPTVVPTVPPTAPAQPGTGNDAPTAETPKPDQQKQPETTKPSPSPSPSQPGVTTPDPNQVMPNPGTKPGSPTQPGVTTPRVAPLPVPGQSGQDKPASIPNPAPGVEQPKPAEPGAAKPATPGADTGTPAEPAETQTVVQNPRWQSPRLESAPAAPVVEMEGPHLEVGANVDGGAVLPGFVANTHHFSNQAGYVGTIGYRTPTGVGEAGLSVEFIDVNTIKVTSYTGGEGLADNKSETILDTTQLNMAKAAVEHWIQSQPGGAEALEAARQAKLPPIVPPGDVAPQSVDVGGVHSQWGGSLQY